MSYYECHITLLGQPSAIQPLVENIGWKFSAIDGDPSLGDGIKCYATKHFNSKLSQEWVKDALTLAARELAACGASVIREKIELVIYDTRSSKVQLP